MGFYDDMGDFTEIAHRDVECRFSMLMLLLVHAMRYFAQSMKTHLRRHDEECLDLVICQILFTLTAKARLDVELVAQVVECGAGDVNTSDDVTTVVWGEGKKNRLIR